ncbi:putative transcription factor bZIP family [Helianthus annuus]|nr:putative transcription factor bZIP family [Helianthus annuus]KAJ0952815.1 putative transcription factor bZIP family [Helianthus annuus]
MSERLVNGLWCRMGFTGHINGKMYKRSFSKAYRYLMHCLVHSLSHRKGAYDEVSDYIMNIVASMVLNRKHNISQVIFEFMKENCEAGIDKYIMYPRFIMMILNDKIKDLPKDINDVMEMSEVNKTTMLRITKDKDSKTKQLICAMKDKDYVAPNDDKWRHDNSNSENEDDKMSEFVEKKTRWWCVKDGKRKRTPKSTPKIVPKETEKGSSGEPQRRLIDETVLEPAEVIKQGNETLKQTLESYFKKNEEVAAKQAQKSVVQEDETLKSSSNEDSEATLSESELVAETLGRGKAQLKKKVLKKKKDSDEEDSPCNPDELKKNRKKRKAAPAGVFPRNVRSRKTSAEPQKELEGKKKQDNVEKSPAVEIQKEISSVESKKLNDDDDVEITGVKFVSPNPIQQDIPESSQPKVEAFNLDFDDLGGATEAEAERKKLEEKIDELVESNNNFINAFVVKENRMKKMQETINDNTQVVDVLSSEISSLNTKVKDLQNINQTLNQLLNEINEASSNEMKAMKLEMEAMKADKVMKDQQLQMLTAVVEAHLKLNIHEAFDQVDVLRANERRQERERQMAEEANLKNKGIVEEVEIVGASVSQPDMGGSSLQPDVEMIDIQEIDENDEEMVEAPVHEPEFLMTGEPVELFILENVLRDVQIIQRRRRAREILLLEYTTDKFVMVGEAYSVPYNGKEVAKLTKFYELKRKGKIARGEMVDDDIDSDLFGDGEEEEEDDDQDDKADDKDVKDEKPDDDDDDDQGTSGLLINNCLFKRR